MYYQRPRDEGSQGRRSAITLVKAQGGERKADARRLWRWQKPVSFDVGS